MTFGETGVVSSILKSSTVWGNKFQAPTVLPPRWSEYRGKDKVSV
jgi:hypothetical protein